MTERSDSDGNSGASARVTYDEIGIGYAQRRIADPRLATPIHTALGHAGTVLNVGAGTGSYEPTDRRVVAVEPSAVMLAQRPGGAATAVQANADALPFANRSFDAVLVVLSLHHWPDRSAGLAELCRVAPLRVVLTFDPVVHNRVWIFDYVPEMAALESAQAPTINEVVESIDGRSVEVIPVPRDCVDGMTIAHWAHPEAYLDPGVRQGGSALRQVDQVALARGLAVLESDLASGRWYRRYGTLLDGEEFDCGLRLIVGRA